MSDPVPGIDFPYTKWGISSMERHVDTGVVYTVHWTVTHFADGEQAGAYGSIGLEAPEEGAEFIPYADLTEETCCGWVCNHFGEEKCQEIIDALSAQIAEKLAPTKAAGIPWG